QQAVIERNAASPADPLGEFQGLTETTLPEATGMQGCWHDEVKARGIGAGLEVSHHELAQRRRIPDLPTELEFRQHFLHRKGVVKQPFTAVKAGRLLHTAGAQGGIRPWQRDATEPAAMLQPGQIGLAIGAESAAVLVGAGAKQALAGSDLAQEILQPCGAVNFLFEKS